MKTVRLLLLFVMFAANTMAAGKLPLKGGENVLFIGNSLTAHLSESLNEMFQTNRLPTFKGHRIQLWNETLETHVKLSPAQTPKKFSEGESNAAGMKGYKVRAAFNSLWKKGQYDRPEFNNKGYITALEAIRLGTPEGKPWDVVVIQGYTDAMKEENRISVGADGKIHAEGPLMIYGSQLIGAAKAAGAEPILYMAWLLNPEQGGGTEDPASYYNTNFDRLIAHYTALAKAHGIKVVPVGAAMRALSKERKPAEARTAWLIRDNVHGTACGAALLHYCLGAALSGKPATVLSYNDKDYAIGEAEPKYNLRITPEIDRAIKQAAQDFLKEYGF